VGSKVVSICYKALRSLFEPPCSGYMAGAAWLSEEMYDASHLSVVTAIRTNFMIVAFIVEPTTAIVASAIDGKYKDEYCCAAKDQNRREA
jgi:hypothetical protein